MADVAQFPERAGLVTSTPLWGCIHDDLDTHSYVLKSRDCDRNISTGVLYRVCLSFSRLGP